MSTILDALKRHSTDADGPPATANADSVLATLARGRRQQKGDVSIRMLLVYGASAVLIGFLGLSGLIYFLAPADAPRPVAQTAAARPLPAPKPPVSQASSTPPPIAAPRQP
ncbi:MAG TPA: hypothetical protein VFP91_17585, partial [Vicinamibacterales bacterium]|nr:hypothetical protein [Vicinamibacterales bacterium]